MIRRCSIFPVSLHWSWSRRMFRYTFWPISNAALSLCWPESSFKSRCKSKCKSIMFNLCQKNRRGI